MQTFHNRLADTQPQTCALRKAVRLIETLEDMFLVFIGYTGSGKSVLAAKLGKILGCPVLHLDKLQFEAGWKERGEAEGKMLCEQFLEENKERGWVIDGNYEKFCQKRRMKEADLIIFMDYPRWICLWQALRRYYRYKGHTRKSMADGCVEKMDKEFILWILKNGRSREKKEDYKRVGAQYPDKFIQVRNRRQLRATVIRLLQLQNEKGLYAGTGSRKR